MTINIYKALLLCSFIGSLLASCSDATELSTLSSTSASAEISGSIGQSTRAYNNTWETNDKIGIYVFDAGTSTVYKTFSNYAYETTSMLGTFSPVSGNTAITLPSNGAKLDFQAYYPYKADLTSETFSVSTWADQSNPQSLDLMLAPKVTDRSMTDKAVHFTFAHQFSKIILNVKANSEESLLQASDLEGMTVSAEGMNVVTNVNVLTGALSNGSAVSTPITFKSVSGGGVADIQATAIVAPGYNHNTQYRQVTFTLNGGKTFRWTIPSGTEFKGGNSYTWTLKLKGEGLVEADVTAEITNWTDNDEGEISLDME